MSRWFAPANSVRVPHTPLYLMPRRGLRGLGDDYTDYSTVTDYSTPVDTIPVDVPTDLQTIYDPSGATATVDYPGLISTDYGTLTPDTQIGDSGLSVGELTDMGYTASEINSMLSADLGGFTQADVMALQNQTGWSASESMNALISANAVINSGWPSGGPVRNIPSSGAGSGFSKGASSGSSGSGAPTPKAPTTTQTATTPQQIVPKPASTGSSVPVAAAGSFFSGSTLIPGVPNMVVIFGAAFLLFGTGYTGGSYKVVRRR